MVPAAPMFLHSDIDIQLSSVRRDSGIQVCSLSTDTPQFLAHTAASFPFGLCVLKMTHALLAGNCLIIKVPPTCPCAALKLVELAQSIFPPGVLSVLYGGNDLYVPPLPFNHYSPS